MKQILYILFLLYTILSFGQQIYKVNEGELQFIDRVEGIILKKSNKYFRLEVDSNYDREDFNLKIETKFNEIPESDFLYLKNQKDIVLNSEIDSYKLIDYESYKYISTHNESSTSTFYKFNKDLYFLNGEFYPYIIFDFGKNKKILYLLESRGDYIIPTKSKLKFLLNFYSGEFNTYQKTQFGKEKAIDIYTGYFSNLHQYYKVDTLKNRKVYFKNLYGKNTLNASFDSIDFNRHFIVGYKGGEIRIYNYKFDELAVSSVRAIKLNKYFPQAQIIQSNTLKHINLLGEEYKRGDGPASIDLSFQFPSNKAVFKIFKENQKFYISGDFNELKTENGTYLSFGNQDKSELYHIAAIENIEYFSENDNSITVNTESGYQKKRPFLIYSKLNNGKYNLNTFDYLLAENPSEKVKNINDELPKNLDSIEKINQDIYLIEKNGFYTYFPINREIKYKSITKFEENFARFELPNGQKGWLDLDGKEYLDE
jgi:hypothetical protein